ncbi:hypothetical protein C8R44DRAFT_852543 [Mycena epipterygia]|nr:hypothetical protein C8R44DRAFT_852543 [Mycena epipterygia]
MATMQSAPRPSIDPSLVGSHNKASFDGSHSKRAKSLSLLSSAATTRAREPAKMRTKSDAEHRKARGNKRSSVGVRTDSQDRRAVRRTSTPEQATPSCVRSLFQRRHPSRPRSSRGLKDDEVGCMLVFFISRSWEVIAGLSHQFERQIKAVVFLQSRSSQEYPPQALRRLRGHELDVGLFVYCVKISEDVKFRTFPDKPYRAPPRPPYRQVARRRPGVNSMKEEGKSPRGCAATLQQLNQDAKMISSG